MFRDILALLFDVHDHVLLSSNKLFHILKQLRQLNHLLLNLLDRLVTALYSIKRSLRMALPTALKQGLGEDLLGRSVLNCLSNLLVRSLWAHNFVLAGHLLLGLLAVLRVSVLVRVDCGLETSIDLSKLWSILWGARFLHGLESLDSLDEPAVHSHDFGTHVVELAVGGGGGGRIWVVQGALLEHLELLKAALNIVDALVDSAAFVQDCVRVAGGGRGAELLAVAGEGLELDGLACWGELDSRGSEEGVGGGKLTAIAIATAIAGIWLGGGAAVASVFWIRRGVAVVATGPVIWVGVSVTEAAVSILLHN